MPLRARCVYSVLFHLHNALSLSAIFIHEYVWYGFSQSWAASSYAVSSASQFTYKCVHWWLLLRSRFVICLFYFAVRCLHFYCACSSFLYFFFSPFFLLSFDAKFIRFVIHCTNLYIHLHSALRVPHAVQRLFKCSDALHDVLCSCFTRSTRTTSRFAHRANDFVKMETSRTKRVSDKCMRQTKTTRTHEVTNKSWRRKNIAKCVPRRLFNALAICVPRSRGKVTAISLPRVAYASFKWNLLFICCVCLCFGFDSSGCALCKHTTLCEQQCNVRWNRMRNFTASSFSSSSRCLFFISSKIVFVRHSPVMNRDTSSNGKDENNLASSYEFQILFSVGFETRFSSFLSSSSLSGETLESRSSAN